MIKETTELREKYSPDGSKLRKEQLYLLDMLIDFDQFCTKHGIKYFLDSGTLIGAVRHNGFIPWDDDIDLLLFPKDYKKLISIASSNSESVMGRFVLHSLQTDFNYPFLYSKFRDESHPAGSSNPQRARLYKYKGSGIDLLPVQRTNTTIARICAFLYQILITRITYKIESVPLRFLYTRSIQFLLLKVLFPMINFPVLLFGDKDEYHFSLGIAWAKRRMYKSKYFPAQKCLFEGKEFPIPNDYDFYLRNSYGDYMKIPNDEQIMCGIHSEKYKKEIQARINIRK